MRRTVSILAFASVLLPAFALAQGGGFVFDDPAPTPAPEPAPAEAAPPPPPPVTDSLADFTFGGGTSDDTGALPPEDRAAWAEADAANTPDALRAYLSAFPQGGFADRARDRLADLLAQQERRAGLISACDRMAGDPADRPTLLARAWGHADWALPLAAVIALAVVPLLIVLD